MSASIVLGLIGIWLARGLFGSWLVIHYVGSRHPWLGLRLMSPLPLAMALLGPFNCVIGVVYAVIFAFG